MGNLSEVLPGSTVVVSGVEGDVRLLTRLASVGVVPGGVVTVQRNDKHRPVLVFERDTALAINREEARRITVSEVDA